MVNKPSQLLRRIFFPLTLLSLLLALPAHATLYDYYKEQGGTLPSVSERAKTAGAFGMFPYTGTAAQNNALERLLRGYQAPKDDGLIGFGVASDYETTLAQSMTSNQTYLVVSSLLTRDSQTVSLANLNASKVYLTLEPGGSKEEFVMCTGVSTTLNRFDGCTRGLSGIGTSTASVSANMRAHIAGSKVTMSNVHYVYNEYVDRDTAQTIGGLKTFSTIPRIPTTTPTDPSEVVSFAMLASTSFAGTVNASTLVKGIVQLPTENEYNSGTVTGTTGALLVSTPAWNLAYSDHHFSNDLSYGQTLSYGNVLFVSTSQKYQKALATDSTVLNKIVAVAFDGAATNTFGRVLFPGSVVYSGSGFTTGSPVFLSDTGVASASAGTNRVSIGVALSNSAWVFNPDANFISSAVTSTANFIPVATASGTLQRGWIPFRFGGDCTDGALSAVNVTTTINLGGSAVFIKNYSSITVTGTGTIAFSNPNSGGTNIILRSCGDVTLTSSASPNIDVRSMGAAGGAGAATGAGTGGTNASNWIAGLVGGGNGGGAGSAGNSGAGGAGGSSAVSAGSAGNTVGSAAGGTAGSTSYWNSESAPYILTYARPGAGGGGGGSGNNNSITGGNGSRGAGGLYIEVGGALNFTGSINAVGTAGLTCAGAAPYSGAGGGGGGGVVTIIYNTLTANSGTITVTGGTGGSCAGGGTGGNGADGFSKVSPNIEF